MLLRTNTNLGRFALMLDILACVVIIPLILHIMPLAHVMERYTAPILIVIGYVYMLYIVIRWFHLPRRLVGRNMALAVTLALFILITHILSEFPFKAGDTSSIPAEVREEWQKQNVWFITLSITGLALSAELLLEWLGQVIIRQQTEYEKTKAELAMYRAQIDPHFLFNTLNSLYSLIVTKSDDAETAFVRFCELMKYTYINAKQEQISLASENEYIEQYVQLQRLRLNAHTKVEFSSHISNPQLSISPMILVNFVENCFKYGVSSNRNCTIYINIEEREGVLTLHCKNDIVRRRSSASVPSIGIENSRKRLDMLYGDRYTLHTEEHEGAYITHLTIRLP